MAPPPLRVPAMPSPQVPSLPLSEPGLHAALMFALVAERLTVFYEHGQWITEAQGATLANDWLARSNRSNSRSLPRLLLKQISAASDAMAREIAGTLSREAGLYTAHEMTEALDPNYPSDLGQSLMAECAQRLAAQDSNDSPAETPTALTQPPSP